MKLSPPWANFFHEVDELFKEDPNIRVSYDEENYTIKLFVDGDVKANALETILPKEKTFGNVVVKIEVVPANFEKTSIDLFKAAFEGNPVFKYSETVTGIFPKPVSYIVFENKVVQYFNDDLGDLHGLRSTLYQDIARDVFEEHEGINFCTDLPDDVNIDV